MTERPSRWLPVLSWRDYPALLDLQRLLGDVDHAASIALERLRGTLEARTEMASKQERELLTVLLRRVEAAQAAVGEAGDDLYRFRKGDA